MTINHRITVILNYYFALAQRTLTVASLPLNLHAIAFIPPEDMQI